MVFNKKALVKLAHSIRVLISKNNAVAKNYATKTPASLLYRVYARKCKWNFTGENIPAVTQFSFREKMSSR